MGDAAPRAGARRPQMERHRCQTAGESLRVSQFCSLHVQDGPGPLLPPRLGWEVGELIFDVLVHPLTMGLEEPS